MYELRSRTAAAARVVVTVKLDADGRSSVVHACQTDSRRPGVDGVRRLPVRRRKGVRAEEIPFRSGTPFKTMTTTARGDQRLPSADRKQQIRTESPFPARKVTWVNLTFLVAKCLVEVTPFIYCDFSNFFKVIILLFSENFKKS